MRSRAHVFCRCIMKFGFLIALIIFLVGACSPKTEQPIYSSETRKAYVNPHVFIIMADDLGIDVGPCHSQTPYMPNLQSRCGSSLVFDKAYAYPYCSATRASIMTGRHSFRHGVNDVQLNAKKLPLSEVTLPEWISRKAPNYRSAAFGKWHLADDENGGANNPNLQGFDHYEGTPRQTGTYNYFEYDWYMNGVNQGRSEIYKTTKITNSVINDFSKNHKSPQFYYVNYVNPHLPFHIPPRELHNIDLPEGQLPKIDPLHTRDTKIDPYYFAMLESLDTEIGRLVDQTISVTQKPIVFIFLGDNGSAQNVYRGDISGGYRGKASLYEGGIRIPVQVWSSDDEAFPVVSGRTDILVHTVDLYATILQLIRPKSTLPKHQMDSKDFAPVFGDLSFRHRDKLYIESGHARSLPFSYTAINDAGYKLILNETERPSRFGASDYLEYYDTNHDPGELRNLLHTPCEVDLREVDDLFEYIVSKRESEVSLVESSFDKEFYQRSILSFQQKCSE